MLAELNHEDGEEIALLTDLSYDVAQHFDGAWSVDWLWDVRGDWYCIDMAVAHMSWGWDKVNHGDTQRVQSSEDESPSKQQT